MSLQERLQRLEALLDRVRRRSGGPRAAEAPQRATGPTVTSTASSSSTISAASSASSSSAASSSTSSAFQPLPPVEAVPLPPVHAVAPAPVPVAPVGFPPAAPPFEPVEVVPAFASEPSLEAPFAEDLPVEEARVSGVVSSPSSSATLEVVETPPLEMLGEEDLVEMSSDVLESVPPPAISTAPADLDFEEEEPPVSSERHKVASRRDPFAADYEAATADEDREVPIKTPPPESGPQQAALPAGLSSPFAPDGRELLEAELPPISARSAALPTPEQLGQTIDLEEAPGPQLELADVRPQTPPPPSGQELEADLPARESALAFDSALVPPAEARDELARLEAQREASPKIESSTESFASLAAPPIAMESTTLPAPGFSEAEATAAPEIVERPPISGVSPVQIHPAARRAPRPSTFVELLDLSITLGG